VVEAHSSVKAPSSGLVYPLAMISSRPLALLAVVALLITACSATGGSPSATDRSPEGVCATSPEPEAGSLEAWSPASQDPSVFPQIVNPGGTIACGQNRFMFSFLDASNVPVASPDRTVNVAFYDLGADPETATATTDATFIWAIEGSVGVYVANVDLPTAGLWGAEFRTTAADTAPETVRVQFDVQPTSTTISVGDEAPASDTPTLADVDGDVSSLSTDDEPVEAFYTTSVADALAANEPFVLVFATPKFCASAQCGPTLDRVKPIAAAHPDLTFINVEPYELTSVDGQLQPVLTGDPAQLTPVAATDEWNLAAEPWVFVVDGDGIVTASLMLIFGDQELEDAIAAVE
jgi:hypothetical protein